MASVLKTQCAIQWIDADGVRRTLRCARLLGTQNRTAAAPALESMKGLIEELNLANIEGREPPAAVLRRTEKLSPAFRKRFIELGLLSRGSQLTGISPSEHGYIYFINGVGQDKIKIGWSGRDPRTRLNELETGCSHSIRLMGVIACQQSGEGSLHRKFRSIRVVKRGNREWFFATKSLRFFVRKILALERSGKKREVQNMIYQTKKSFRPAQFNDPFLDHGEAS